MREEDRLRREIARGAGVTAVRRLLAVLEATGPGATHGDPLAAFRCDEEDAASGVFLVRHKNDQRIEGWAEQFGHLLGREFPDAEVTVGDVGAHGLLIVVHRRGMTEGEVLEAAGRAWEKRSARLSDDLLRHFNRRALEADAAFQAHDFGGEVIVVGPWERRPGLTADVLSRTVSVRGVGQASFHVEFTEAGDEVMHSWAGP